MVANKVHLAMCGSSYAEVMILNSNLKDVTRFINLDMFFFFYLKTRYPIQGSTNPGEPIPPAGARLKT